jgi:ADP-heptose:LPS heptosyltransferase
MSATHSVFGYDTRSLRSALVMRTVDLINPFKRARKFHWDGPCVVSSIAGLGDLFIHLPLISGIIAACRTRGLEITVALRPKHVEIGKRCGWDVMPFDNGLEEFFKNPGALRFSDILGSIRRARKQAPALWIDLTGNALSAVVLKAGGVKRLAARTTRGGKSLVDHPLPHAVQENEYQNRARVADFLGCELDLELADRLTGEASKDSDCVVLCVTTASRWKNWPLANFRSLIERFPQVRFAVIGFRSEVLREELPELDTILRQPNAVNRMDQLSAGQMLDLIAQCRAVVTNDTSAAHIANFFAKPGAVLFGPVSPGTFAAPDGLRVFHDATCPYHPCVQWRCDNETNWCMRKIRPRDVADHLADILQSREEITATRSTVDPSQKPANQPDWQRQPQLPV